MWATATPILRDWMRERTSVRTLARELRARVPGLMEAVRGLPGLLGLLVEREQTRLQPPAAAPEVGELRAALERSARRREAATLGAALLLGGLVWLAVSREPAWVGWGLLVAGTAAVVYGLWRAS